MYYALFEASPYEGKEKLGESYYKSLLPHLHESAGFREDSFRLSPHRRSAVNISVWDDVDAAWRWRNEGNHLRMQSKGTDVYEIYRLRLGPKAGDNDKAEETKTRHHLTLFYCNNVEGTPPDNVTEVLEDDVAAKLKDDVVESLVYQGDQTVWITTWKSEDAATRFEQAVKESIEGKVVRIRIQRDYTKTARADAPHETPGMT